ncbi:MAG TPA: tripartite tricarboxylate transporter substrate binding protein [Xanthobacteraceae bacterium]|nr:tripartite tricarboxylate transporter substrate binding protein [Xanthobacteraceae bacterium]
MITSRIALPTILALAVGIFGLSAASAQPYPARPIKLIVPFPPGGPVDVTARIIAQHLPRTLGQTVVVENRAGAAGALGAKAVAGADPDGYTLLCGNISTLVVLPAVTNNRDYDPAKVFVPIAKVSQNHEVLVVHPAFPAKSVAELVTYAKANPGKLNFGSAGHGNATHLAAELFKLKTGTDIVHIPYKGAAEAVTGVLGGQVHMFFGDIGGVLPLMREGTLRALAVSSDARNPLVPDLPTMIESGVPDYVVLTYIGVVAPAGTPESIIGRLSAAINASLTAPEVMAAFAKLGAEVRPDSPQAFAAFLAAETQKWATVAKAANIKID